MNIQAEKIELTKLLLNTENPSIIQSIKDIFTKARPIDFWDSLTIEQKHEIKAGSLELEKGESSDYEEFISKHK